MFKINFSRQTAPAAEEPAALPEILVREDFTLIVDDLTVTQILQTLRADTIDFVEDNRLAWGASDFNVRGVDVRVKLTENWDVVYIFDGATMFNTKDAAAYIEAQMQF